ncbi:hypothetical protein Tco_0435765 [Tanacetum coccineum]
MDFITKFPRSSKEWNSGDDQLRLRWMIYLVVLEDAVKNVRDAIGFEYCLASLSGWTKETYDLDFGRYNEGMLPVLWAEIGESSLTGLELVQETIDKVVLVKEKPKAVRDRQKSYVDYRCKPLEFEVGDRVLLRMSPWKGVMHFGKKGKLALRYVGPFEILERIGLVAYRLRLPEELSSVHDTFHVSNLKKCLANDNLHVPLDEIKVDKTLHFVEEPVEIMDREIKKLKHRKIALVKVRWNSKRGPAKSGGLLAGIHGLFSGRYYGLVRRVTCGYPWPGLEGSHRDFGMIQERFRSSAWCLRDRMVRLFMSLVMREIGGYASPIFEDDLLCLIMMDCIAMLAIRQCAVMIPFLVAPRVFALAGCDGERLEFLINKLGMRSFTSETLKRLADEAEE